ncbi:TIGR00159 family protein [Granulicatella sp. zg-ZJ]|nr:MULTISPECIES: diadenylate cyclase CdaA [unclassified Granulicatella]NEW62737.1 TIGR00159 family protein [Granulicatella sp. zg-ZJ]NEW65563.1 TIGR00159 family protein [Granulicatella sp. zg-84]QMI85556.1 TIGR00159 family protein [Carnobacteriaceae bacterium zg-84]
MWYTVYDIFQGVASVDINNLLSLSNLSYVIDVVIVTYLIYLLITFSKNTRTINVLKGVLVIVLIKFVSNLLHLLMMSWIIDQVITWGVITVVIIFQPEIRRALEQLGQNNFFKKKKQDAQSETLYVIDALEEATQYLAKRSIGALISIEKQSSLHPYIQSGVSVDAHISSQLLINLFIPNTPLHDGAVIIKENRIVAASCVLPLSENPNIPQELGTRHRAAIGLSEVSDALTLIVSEETGHISVTHHQDIHRNLTKEELRRILESHLNHEQIGIASAKGHFLKKIMEFLKGGEH